MSRIFFSIGSLCAGIAVAAGAYAAHAGETTLTAEQLLWINKAARYQMYHGLALIMVSLAMVNWPEKARLFSASGWLFLLGIVFFSCSLYWMAFGGANTGYIVPAGGISFLAGWLLMAVAPLRKS